MSKNDEKNVKNVQKPAKNRRKYRIVAKNVENAEKTLKM